MFLAIKLVPILSKAFVCCNLFYFLPSALFYTRRWSGWPPTPWGICDKNINMFLCKCSYSLMNDSNTLCFEHIKMLWFITCSWTLKQHHHTLFPLNNWVWWCCFNFHTSIDRPGKLDLQVVSQRLRKQLCDLLLWKWHNKKYPALIHFPIISSRNQWKRKEGR